MSPWLEALLHDPDAHALYLFPTKVGRCSLTLSNPALKAPGTQRLKLKYDELHSILLQFCFRFQLAPLNQGAGTGPASGAAGIAWRILPATSSKPF